VRTTTIDVFRIIGISSRRNGRLTLLFADIVTKIGEEKFALMIYKITNVFVEFFKSRKVNVIISTNGPTRGVAYRTQYSSFGNGFGTSFFSGRIQAMESDKVQRLPNRIY
jgi:hypothetical protein